MVLGSLGSLGRSAAYLWVCCAKIYVLLSKGFVVNDGRRFWPLTDYFFSRLHMLCTLVSFPCGGALVFGSHCGDGLLRMWAINLSYN